MLHWSSVFLVLVYVKSSVFNNESERTMSQGSSSGGLAEVLGRAAE